MSRRISENPQSETRPHSSPDSSCGRENSAEVLPNPLLTEAVHLSHFEYKMFKVLRKCPTLSHPRK